MAGEFERLEDGALETLELLDGLLPEQHPQVRDAELWLVSLERLWALDSEALVPAMEALALMGEGHRLMSGADRGQAIEVVARSLRMQKRQLGSLDSSALNQMGSLAVFAFNSGDSAGAEALATLVLNGLFDLLGASHPRTAAAFGNLGYFLTVRRSFADAECMLLHSLAQRKLLMGVETASFANQLFNLGQLYRDSDRVQEAEGIIERCLSIRQTLEVNPASIGMAYSQLGSVRRILGRPLEARASLLQAFAYYEGSLPRDHHERAQSLAALALTEMQLQNYPKAIEHGLACTEMYARMHPGGSSLHAHSMQTLGVIYERAGKLDQAERWIRKAQQGFDAHFPAEHTLRIENQAHLASVLLARGEWREARSVLLANLDVRMSVYGEASRVIAGDFSDLAQVASLLGATDEAVRLASKSYGIQREILGPEHSVVLRSIVRLTGLLLDAGRTEEAREWLARIDVDTPAARGLAPGVRANRQLMLARCLGQAGDLVGAVEATALALEILRAIDGAHPLVASALGLHGEFLMQRGDYREASTHLEAALSLCEYLRDRVLGDERDRASYAGRLSMARIAQALVLARASQGDALGALAAAERGRGRALLDLLGRSADDLVRLAREAQPEGEERLGLLLDSERQARETLLEAELALRLGAIQDGDSGQQLETIRRRRDDLRAAGSELTAAMADVFPKAAAAEPVQILEALQSGERLLHYSFGQHGVVLLASDAEGRLEAHVLARGAVPTADLSAQIQVLLQSLASGAALEPHFLEALSLRLLPAAVAADLVLAQRAVVLPDGPLHGLPFECLMLAGKPWLSAGPSTTYSPSGSVLLRRSVGAQAFPVKGRAALVLGAPDFGGQDTRKRPASARAGASILDRRTEWTALDAIRLFGDRLAPLPATAIEVQRVSERLTGAGLVVKRLTGAAATQEFLESELQGVSVLHLATHGLRAHPERPFEAALALAPPTDPNSLGDGVLTLDELIRNWGGRLADCELVTLSACDTNVGAQLGESVVSLYWGFFHAGAKRSLVSLWKVDDRATLLFMDRFYTNWCGDFEGSRLVGGREYAGGRSMPIPVALHEARIYLASSTPADNRSRLQELQAPASGGLRCSDDTFPRPGADPKAQAVDAQFDFSHPRYWSAFVLYGG